MKAKTKNQDEIELREINKSDFEQLSIYFEHLSKETKSRFGPHGYDLNSIGNFYEQAENRGYIALNRKTEIVAYSILRKGFLQHDSFRLESYGLHLSMDTDSTFAPSVADAYQSQGIGLLLFDYILDQIKGSTIERIILWGGVQSNNEKAVNFYKKKGFRTLGEFEYYGLNNDMVLEL